MTATYNPQDVKVIVNGIVIDGITIDCFESIKPDSSKEGYGLGQQDGIGLGKSLEGWDF